MTFFDPSVALGWWAPLVTIVAAVLVVRAQSKVARANAAVAEAQAKTHTAEIWESEARAIRTRADRLQDENKLLVENNGKLTTEVTRLRSLPDMSRLMDLLLTQQNEGGERYTDAMERIATLFDQHEERAAERHHHTIQAVGHLTTGMSGMMETMAALQAGMLDLVERVEGSSPWDGEVDRRGQT